MLLQQSAYSIITGTGSQVTPGFPHSQFCLRVTSPKVREHGRTTPVAYELAADTCYGLGVVTDTTHINHIRKDDERLWTAFKMAFQDAWMDTSKKQNTYNQLMKLTMEGWDIDNYIATFDRLALAAGWELNAEGTIVHFREGLSKGIHSKALDRDKIPHTMDEWKAAACTKVARAKEKYNAGHTNTQRHNQQTRQYNTTQNQQQGTAQNNPNIVPMDVDATTMTNFKKLTPYS